MGGSIMKIYITARKNSKYPNGYVPSYRRTKPQKNLVLAVNVEDRGDEGSMIEEALDEAISTGLMFVDAFARDRFTGKVLEGLK